MRERIISRLIIRLVSLMMLCLGLSSCSLIEINEQIKRVEGYVLLEGYVDDQNGQQGQIYVILFRYSGTFFGEIDFEVLNRQAANNDGSYRFHVLPGNYTVAAYIDLNGDLEYQQGEPANYFGQNKGQPNLYTVQANESLELPDLAIAGPIYRRANVTLELNPSTILSADIGRIVSLDDPMFSAASANLGLWRPMQFLEEVSAGVFMLRAYERGKIPVLFIHGINGSPVQFSSLIDGLDTDKYQPWVLAYPSGVRLDMVSDYLLAAVNQLHAQHQFSEMYIVAHSMGGLMLRSFIFKHQQRKSPAKLGLVVTVNSPLYGMESAAKGVKNSPIVLPVWRDVASDSDYVQRMHETPWPKGVPYHLVFSYKDNSDGDGVVAMHSQLSRSLQREATQIHGFNVEHSSILKNPEFIGLLERVMEAPAKQH